MKRNRWPTLAHQFARCQSPVQHHHLWHCVQAAICSFCSFTGCSIGLRQSRAECGRSALCHRWCRASAGATSDTVRPPVQRDQNSRRSVSLQRSTRPFHCGRRGRWPAQEKPLAHKRHQNAAGPFASWNCPLAYEAHRKIRAQLAMRPKPCIIAPQRGTSANTHAQTAYRQPECRESAGAGLEAPKPSFGMDNIVPIISFFSQFQT